MCGFENLGILGKGSSIQALAIKKSAETSNTKTLKKGDMSKKVGKQGVGSHGYQSYITAST